MGGQNKQKSIFGLLHPPLVIGQNPKAFPLYLQQDWWTLIPHSEERRRDTSWLLVDCVVGCTVNCEAMKNVIINTNTNYIYNGFRAESLRSGVTYRLYLLVQIYLNMSKSWKLDFPLTCLIDRNTNSRFAAWSGGLWDPVFPDVYASRRHYFVGGEERGNYGQRLLPPP